MAVFQLLQPIATDSKSLNKPIAVKKHPSIMRHNLPGGSMGHCVQKTVTPCRRVDDVAPSLFFHGFYSDC